MPGKRKGRLKEFQRKTDNADLEQQRKQRKEKLSQRKKEIQVKKTRKNPEERKKYKLNRTRVIRLAVVLVIVVFLGVWTYKIGSELYEQSQLEEKNAQLTEEKEQKEEELKNSNSTDYIEKKARDELKMVKPGEKLFVLDKDKTDQEKKDDTEEDK